jgi:hypothetical protein
MPQKPPIRPTTQIGRTAFVVRTPSAEETARTRQRRQAEQRAETLEEERKQRRAVEAELAATRDKLESVRIAAIVARRSVARDEATTRKITNLIEHKRRKYAARGQKFDVYLEIATVEHRLGLTALPPSPRGANRDQVPLPPTSEARPGPQSEAERVRAEEARRSSYERGRALVEERERIREAYKKRLRELGLTDPSLGWPGANPGRSVTGY